MLSGSQRPLTPRANTPLDAVIRTRLDQRSMYDQRQRDAERGMRSGTVASRQKEQRRRHSPGLGNCPFRTTATTRGLQDDAPGNANAGLPVRLDIRPQFRQMRASRRHVESAGVKRAAASGRIRPARRAPLVLVAKAVATGGAVATKKQSANANEALARLGSRHRPLAFVLQEPTFRETNEAVVVK
jgi:hypothetical protein